MQNDSFLEQLLSTASPTGFESKGQQVWIDELKQYSTEIITDPYGSAAAALIKNSSLPTLLLEAHCDEIGMMVNYINDKGFVYVSKLGGSDVTIAKAKRVIIHSKKGSVSGVIGNTAIHLQDRENNKQPKWNEIFIDIGVSSKEEALELIQIGDPITFADDFEWLNDNLLMGRALDNRIGGYIIAEAFKKLYSQKEILEVNIIAVNSVQEEIGGFGARMMAQLLKPNFAIVTDVTHATDIPGIDVREHGLVNLGGGPSLTHGSANQVNLVNFIEEIANESEIEIQHEATSNRTGTDTDSIFFQNGGIISALISLPLRYMHSPSEVAAKSDIESLIELITLTALKMNKNQDFSILSH